MNRIPRRHRLPRAAATVAILPLLLAGCGGEDDPDPADNANANANANADADDAEEVGEGAVITIVDFEYETTGTIEPGAEITLTNEDSVGHTVTSDEEGIFDVAVGPGETVTFTAPEEPGEYSYYCVPHPEMVSTLVVEEPAGR